MDRSTYGVRRASRCGRAGAWWRAGVLSTVLALAGCGLTGPKDLDQDAGSGVRVRLLAFNDFHGQLESSGLTLRLREPTGALRSHPVGGAVNLAATLASLAAERPHAMILSSGDLIGASPLSSALYRDEPTIEVMNALGVGLNVVGNHEFDKGVTELRRMVSGGCHAQAASHGGDASASGSAFSSCEGKDGRYVGARFPFLAANVELEGGGTLFPPYLIRTFGGQRIAFIGVVTRTTPTIVSPSGVAGVRFLDEATTVNRYVDEVRAQGVEAIAVVIHEGGAIAGDWNDPACPGARGRVFQIADRLSSAVDLVFSAHTHQGYSCVRDAPGNPGLRIVQAYAQGRAVSVLDVVIDPATRDVVRSRTVARNVPVRADASAAVAAPGAAGGAGQAGDAGGSGGTGSGGTGSGGTGSGGTGSGVSGGSTLAVADTVRRVAAIVDHYVRAAETRAGRPVGSILATFDREGRRGGDSAAGRLVADAHLAATRAPALGGAVVAFTNPGGVRTDLRCIGTPPCPVSYGQVFATQPFGNALVVMSLSGAQIKALLEQQFTGVNAASPRILNPSAGFSYRYRPAAPAGERVSDIQLHGVAVDAAAQYRVTVNAFLADGGDGFGVLLEGRDRLGGPLDVDALADYLRVHSPVSVDRTLRVLRAE